MIWWWRKVDRDLSNLELRTAEVLEDLTGNSNITNKYLHKNLLKKHKKYWEIPLRQLLEKYFLRFFWVPALFWVSDIQKPTRLYDPHLQSCLQDSDTDMKQIVNDKCAECHRAVFGSSPQGSVNWRPKAGRNHDVLV